MADALRKAVAAEDWTLARRLVERAQGDSASDSGSDWASDCANALADAHAWWMLANAVVDDLGDPAAGKAALRHALALQTTTAGATVVARAWHCHFGPQPGRPSGAMDTSGLDEAMARAAQLATSTDDWITLAEAAHDCPSGLTAQPAELRALLDKALAAAGDDSERHQVAAALQRLLDDGEMAAPMARARAAQVAAQLAKQQATQRQSPVPGFHADHRALLLALCPRVTDAMLHDIARADYGSDYDKHLRAVRAIRDERYVGGPLPWVPHEVLSLRQWSEGERVDHVQRAFVTCVLLVDACGPDARDGLEQTVAILLDSCLALGEEAVAQLMGLLTALVGFTEDWDPLRVFCLFGLLLAATHLDPSDPRIPGLTAQVRAAEAALAETGYMQPEHGWLLGTTFFDQRHALWEALAERCLGAESWMELRTTP